MKRETFYAHWEREDSYWSLGSKDGPRVERVQPNCWIVMESVEQDRDWGHWIDHAPIAVYFTEQDAVDLVTLLQNEYGDRIIHETVSPRPGDHYRDDEEWYRIVES